MDDKYGVKVENRYALFLVDDDNENDENRLLEQASAKPVKNTPATSTGKAGAPSPQKGAKAQSSTGATDARVKSATESGAGGAKKTTSTAGSAAGTKPNSATSSGATKDGQQSGRVKSGAPRENNSQNTDQAKFGRPRGENQPNSDRSYEDRGGQNRPRGGGARAYVDRPEGGEQGGQHYGGERRGGYRGDGERRGGYRGGYRGGDGGEGGRGGYRGGDRQDRPPRPPRNFDGEGGQDRSEHAHAESGGAAKGDTEHGENYGQREADTANTGSREGYNSEYGGRGGGSSRGGGVGYHGQREYRGGNRDGYRGGYRGRQEGDQQGGESYGRRQYDRHSGNEQTGVKAVEKKQGAGGHNWGTLVDQDALEHGAAGTYGEENGDENTAERPAHEGRKRTKEEEEFAAQRAERERKMEQERAEDEKKMTLQQYKELQKEAKEAPKYNLRKPGEGEDKSWLKNVTLVTESRKTHAEQEEEGRKEERTKAHAQDHNLAQDILGIRYEPSSRVEQRGGFRGDRGDRRGGYRDGGRGDRGGYHREGEQDSRRGGYGGEHGGERGGSYQGGRGGGGQGSARKYAPAPSITDPKDFPALGLGKVPATKE